MGKIDLSISDYIMPRGGKNSNPGKDFKLSTVLSAIVDELKAAFLEKLHKVFLFGSYARGEANLDSDMDILVLLDVPKPDSEDCLDALAGIGYRIIDKYGVVSTIIPENKNEFYDNTDVISFFKNIKKEGILLYET
jgi:predicted nucleotidyltransferase